jgi:hypothetical protein
MFTRVSFFVFAMSSGVLVAAAACSSNATAPTTQCEVEVACYVVDSDGFCGAEKSSAPCSTVCPDGYTTQCMKRPQGDAGGVCQIEVSCYQVTDSGVCGAQILSAPCQTCPVGYVEPGECTLAEDGGASDGATTDGASDATPE